MSNVLELAASYGQVGLTMWMLFEVRDVRRWLRTHIEVHHGQQPTKK